MCAVFMLRSPAQRLVSSYDRVGLYLAIDGLNRHALAKPSTRRGETSMPTIHSTAPGSAIDRAPSAGLRALTPSRAKIAATLAAASWTLAGSLTVFGSAAAAGS